MIRLGMSGFGSFLWMCLWMPSSPPAAMSGEPSYNYGASATLAKMVSQEHNQ